MKTDLWLKSDSKEILIKKIREKAIARHDKTAAYIDTEYQKAGKDYFVSAFAYGRKKLEILLSETLQGLPKGSMILDIGCGTGEQIKSCCQLGFNVAGIEPSVEMRNIAQRHNPEVSIQDGIVTSLPFQDKSFDFVLAIEVLRYLHRADILQAYREILRVLRPGGRFFFTMVSRYALDGFYIYDTFKRFISRLTPYQEPVHCEFATQKQIQDDLNSLGVKEVAFYGRMFAPLMFAYKINDVLGAKITKALEPFDDSLCQKKWMAHFAWHLVVIGARSTG
jgi:ubiquinone/menaquinone biosynthesis C-methylase UbiE